MSRPTKVLIVDDDVSFAESFLDILKEKGCEGLIAKSGVQAILKIMGEVFFDIIFMDMRMLTLNGLETFKRIKNISPQTPVIMITANVDAHGTCEDSLKEGIYEVMYKPLDIDKILNMLEAIRSKKKVMITVVDDDFSIRFTLKDILEDKGYEVTLARDGEEAIEIIKRRPEEIIFIDINLPMLDGLQTYVEIKKINPEIATVIMTAYDQELGGLAEQALKKGAYAYLRKPFDPKEAINIVEEIIKKKQSVKIGEKNA
ncbi:MAG: response regulator [Candidatus Omnitrophota bacterium]|nr:response regulator [Candidatus Omnitrophota bacterium]